MIKKLHNLPQGFPLYLIAVLLVIIIIQNFITYSYHYASDDLASDLSEITDELKTINESHLEGSDDLSSKIEKLNSSIDNFRFSVEEVLNSEKTPVPVNIINVDKYALKWLKYSEDDALPVKIKNNQF
jgi:hypothetical protein